MPEPDAGIYYVRAWMRGRDEPFETKHTDLAQAESDLDERYRDRAYTRVEFLVCREWMTRSIKQKE